MLALWVGLSCIFMKLANWEPKPEHGFMGYLAPIPPFGALAIAFMFGIDWYLLYPLILLRGIFILP